jgi:hypothetical protein
MGDDIDAEMLGAFLGIQQEETAKLPSIAEQKRYCKAKIANLSRSTLIIAAKYIHDSACGDQLRESNLGLTVDINMLSGDVLSGLYKIILYSVERK